MGDALFQLGRDLMAAAQGPLQFRVLMQAVVAVGFGFSDGVLGARRGLPPYGPLGEDASRRQAVAHDVWAGLGKVLAAVLLMDVAAQAIVLGFGALALGLAIALLAALPLYLATRAGVTWLFLKGQRRATRRAP